MAENDRRGGLTPRQRAFVGHLFGQSVEAAGAAVGVSPRTAWRWAAAPEVRAALAQAQQEALAQVTRRAVAAMAEALDVLRGIAADPDAPTGGRVQAARAILENALRFAEAVTLEERVRALEEAQKGGDR